MRNHVVKLMFSTSEHVIWKKTNEEEGTPWPSDTNDCEGVENLESNVTTQVDDPPTNSYSCTSFKLRANTFSTSGRVDFTLSLFHWIWYL